MFAQHGDTAREILALLLDRYVKRGILQFNMLSELMKVQPFDRLQAEVTALRAEHTAIRQANAALLPATLERVFTGPAAHRQPD